MPIGAAYIQVGPDCDDNGDIFIVVFPKVCSLKKNHKDAILALDYITCIPRALSK